MKHVVSFPKRVHTAYTHVLLPKEEAPRIHMFLQDVDYYTRGIADSQFTGYETAEKNRDVLGAQGVRGQIDQFQKGN